MTTTTVPDVDLEQWLAGEIELPCQLLLPFVRTQCGQPADWFMATAALRPCPRTRDRSVFVCHACRVTAGVVGFVYDADCGGVHRITFTERIR